MMRLATQRYVELIRSDAELMAQAAPRGIDKLVPACPGWDVREVVRHTGSVYRHKVACMRLNREPADGEWLSGPPDGEDLVTWFRASAASLIDELLTREPETTSYTWWPPDQTVGFWYRRMALETVVHRVDVESAFGNPSPVDEQLAADGVDEILEIMLSGPDIELPAGQPAGRAVVRCGEDVWSVDLTPDATHVAKVGRDVIGSGELMGSASNLFLYLWGRAPSSAVQRSGDITLLDALRERLAAATQ